MFTFYGVLVLISIVFAQESGGNRDDLDATEGGNRIQSLVMTFDQKFGGDKEALSRQIYTKGISRPAAFKILDEFVTQLKDQGAAYDFVKAKGIEKVVTPLMNDADVLYVETGIQIIKKLFELIPTTVKYVMPYHFLDTVLDKFESNMSPKLNRHAVELLSLWLPGNPGAQTHVLRVKGLEPFYSQVSHLDPDVVAKLLMLYKTLIEEHMNIINEQKPKTKSEESVQGMYKKMAFLDMLSTERICMAIVLLYEEQVPDRDKLILHIMDLLKITKPLCFDEYKRKRRFVNFLTDVETHISDPVLVEHFNALGINPPEITKFIQEYKRELKNREDEL